VDPDEQVLSLVDFVVEELVYLLRVDFQLVLVEDFEAAFARVVSVDGQGGELLDHLEALFR
jgi:hypothetical protein